MGGPKCGGNKSRLRGRISLTSGAIDMRRLLKNIRPFKRATKNQWWWITFYQLTNNFCSVAWRRCWGQGSGGSRNGWDRVPGKDPGCYQIWPFQVQFEISRLVSVQTSLWFLCSIANQIKNARTRVSFVNFNPRGYFWLLSKTLVAASKHNLPVLLTFRIFIHTR